MSTYWNIWRDFILGYDTAIGITNAQKNLLYACNVCKDGHLIRIAQLQNKLALCYGAEARSVLQSVPRTALW